MSDIDVRIEIGGTPYEPARYNRLVALDEPGATWSAMFASCNIDPWDEVVIYEDGTKVLTGYALSRRDDFLGTEVTGSDTYIRAKDKIVETDVETTSGSSAYDYAKLLLDFAGLSYNIDTELQSQGVEPNIKLGPATVHDALLSVVKYAGVFIWVDSDGVVNIGGLPEPTPQTHSGFIRHEWEQSDTTTRHTIKVYGFSSGSPLYTRIFGKAVGGTLGDPVERIGVIESPHIMSSDIAQQVAEEALDYYNSHDDIRTVELDGFRPALYVPGTMVDEGDTKHITELEVRLDENGATTTVVLDRRCGLFDADLLQFGDATKATIVRGVGAPHVYTTSSIVSGSWSARDNGEFTAVSANPTMISSNPTDEYETVVADYFSCEVFRWADISESSGSWHLCWDGDYELWYMEWSSESYSTLHDIKYDTSGNLWVLVQRWSGDAEWSKMGIIKANHDFSSWEMLCWWNPFPTPNYIGWPTYDPDKPYRPHWDYWSSRQKARLFVSDDWLFVFGSTGGDYTSWPSGSHSHYHTANVWRVGKTTGTVVQELDFFDTIYCGTDPLNIVSSESNLHIKQYHNSTGYVQYLNYYVYLYDDADPDLSTWRYYQWRTDDCWASDPPENFNPPPDRVTWTGVDEVEPSTWPTSTAWWDDGEPYNAEHAQATFCDFESGNRQARVVEEYRTTGSGSAHYNIGAGWSTFVTPTKGSIAWLPGQQRLVYTSGSYGIRYTNDYGDNWLNGPALSGFTADDVCFHDELFID